MCHMESIFLLDERARANLFHHILHSFASSTTSYICLWSYLQPSNCLLFMDGLYHEENIQPGFSSPARSLFDQYRQSIFTVNGRVPGLAFKNSLPYIEIKEVDLLSRASIESQLQFYQEARIKTAIFMGCKTGEIEIGMSNGTRVNMGEEMKKWFVEDLSGQPLLREVPLLPISQTRPSSSSSSMRSAPSMDSTECSPFLYTTSTPNTSYPQEAPIEQALGPFISTTTTTSPHSQAIQALSQIRGTNQFLTIESEDAAMTKAILAVISSPSSSSSSSSHRSAFRNYRSVLAPSSSTTTQLTTKLQKQNMLKRSIKFFRSLSLVMQNQEQGSRPPSSQLHHMISERRRREKLNESFQALRSLLPPGSKKDKSSVLTSTMEYVSCLKAQVAELARRNQLLEAQFFPAKEGDHREVINGYSNVRLDVQVTNIAESTSEDRLVDLRVIVRGECDLLDFVIRILDFLKLVKNVSLMSAEAETRIVESSPIKRVILKLKIEGSDWDEPAFQEAIRRVVADLAQ
ncbi:putative transcription factor bHLH041 [Cornus florida]|uniref:putative transcription factor bHLH041 n=1 Tax=Cornus florida TaxID=4283 RepID=UPI0028A26EFA|nr:putative transcription factor bHLH041 [Cornus florida]